MTDNVVLFVEDSAEDVDLVLASFRHWKFTNPVQVVPDGEEAMNYLSGIGKFADRALYPFPALVLLDLNLPRITGLELLKWIRAQGEISKLPVVVLTGSKNIDDFNQAYHLGANACTAKTLDLAELRDLLQHINYFSLATDYNTGDVEWSPDV
jgi:CheY-like chemotaxis protein